ncbi:hypothetical protein ABZX92_28035 [Lentzea sp. NPDC006480]|uniref:hypothetical protein n=1 Tax=Lentzea sp. NPDC006480 TaxID=3157176 RepID=UPI0033A05C13
MSKGVMTVVAGHRALPAELGSMGSRRAADGGALCLSPWHRVHIHPGTPGSRFAPPVGRAARHGRPVGSTTVDGAQDPSFQPAPARPIARMVTLIELGTAIDARRRSAPTANEPRTARRAAPRHAMISHGQQRRVKAGERALTRHY